MPREGIVNVLLVYLVIAALFVAYILIRRILKKKGQEPKNK